MSHPRRSLIRSSLEHLRRLWHRRDSGRREMRRQLGTTFEMLEPRLAMTISAPLPPVFDPNNLNNGAHIHPFLTLIENGQQVVIPAGIGITGTVANPTNFFSPHTHDFTGKLHIGEGPAGTAGELRNTTLKDFFDVWRTVPGQIGGQNANAIFDTDANDGTPLARFMDKTVDATHTIRMYVKETSDSAPELEYDSAAGINTLGTRPELYVPRDGDQIIIDYEPTSQVAFTPTFNPISNQTVLGGAPTWLGINGIDPDGGPLTYTVSSSNPNLVQAIIPTGNKSLVLNTSNNTEVQYGQMVFQLFDNLMPRTTSHIEALVNDGEFANNSSFYRIAYSGSTPFVIQGGPSNSTSSLGQFDDEFNSDLQFTSTGLLAMAKSSDDTNDDQIFVTAGPTRFLDFQHSIFGVLTEGDAVRQAIQASRTSGDGAPPNAITITSAQIITDTQNAALELKAAPGASGQADITVTVKDAQNHTYSQTFHVIVAPDTNNPAPFLNPIAPVTGTAGQPITVQLGATDAQNGEVQTITRNATGNTVFSFNGVNATTINFTATTSAAEIQTALNSIPALNGNISVAGSAGGPYTVTFSGALANQNVATLGVNNSNATVQTVSSLFFDASKPSTETVNYTLNVNHDTGLVTITPPAGFSGTFHVNMGVRGATTRTTADQFDTENVLVTVSAGAPTGIDLNDASDSGSSHTDNITNASTLDFTISGVTTGATVKLLKGSTILAQGQATSSTITLTIANPGSVLGQGVSAITATQTNNGQESAATAPLNITYDTTVPTFTSTAPTAAQVGFNLNYDAQTNEEGSNSGLTYSLTSNNVGATINPTTGVVSWTPTSAQAGTNQGFTVVATDAAGNTASQPLTLAVANPVVDVKLTLTKPDGSPLTTLSIGQDFVLHVFAQDLRSTPQGVFALYNDITFTSSLATVTGAITYGSNYPNGHSGTASTGLVDEAGAFTTSSNLGGNALEVYSVPMRATGTGTLTIATDPAEDSPTHDVLILGQNDSVPDAQIHYGSASIEVGSTFNAVNDTFTANEDTQNNTINPLANDTNVGSNTNTLTISAVGQTNHGGTVTISSDSKTLLYTPAANFSGAETFTYTAKNQNNETHVATITMNVADVNDPPIANNDTVSVPRNSSGNVINVLANDTTGVDTGETLRVSAVGTGNHGGTITIGANGANVIYTPAANFSGTETFTYTISDRAAGVSGALTAQGTVTVTVSGLIANNDSGASFTFDEDSGAHTLDVLANDVADPQVPNSVLTITTTGPTDHGGVVTITQNNTRLSYTPAANFQGTEKFTYTISDGQGHTATATVTMTINNVNDPPTATDDTLSAFKNTPATLDVLANDTSAPDPAETLTLDSIVTAPQHGTATIVNGKVQYTPNTDYTGADSFTYKIKDPGGLTSTATANITVQDFAPSVLSGFVYFDTNNNGIKDANEVGLVGITITLTGTASAGSNTANNGINLTTKTLEDGSYKFETLAPGTYTIKETQPLFVIDGKATAGSQGGTAGTNQITITNLAQNTTGTSNNFGEKGRALTTISLRDFFSSTSKNYAWAAFDNSGAELWHVTTGAVWQGYTSNAFSLTNSQIKLNSTNAQSQVITKLMDTSLPVYQGGTSGTSTFYYVPGGPGGSSTNQAPTGVADSFTATLNTALTVNAANGVLKNDTDPEGKTLTATKVSDPAHGTLTLNADGSFTYTPTTGFTGSDSFTYKASDGTKQSGVTTVSITVNTTSSTPTAAADTFTATEDTILTVTTANGVLKNDTGSNLTAVKLTDPSKGTVNLASDGSFTYVPSANATGTDTFTYKAVSGSNESTPATVTITITAVNDLPVAVDNTYSTTKNTPLTTTTSNGLLLNDTDADSDPLTVVTTSVSTPAHGTVTVNANGTFTYTPATDYIGDDSFTYKINDSHADSTNPATVTIHVTPPTNHAPVAVDDVYNVEEDSGQTTVSAGVLDNDTDADSGDQANLKAVQVAAPAHGTLTFNDDGTFTYTPQANFFGDDVFTYKADDQHASNNLSNVATVTIHVAAVNDAPVGVNDSYRVNPGVTLTVIPADGVLKNDTDVDSVHANLTATIITQPAHGTVVLNPDGSFTYTPKNDNFTGGPDPFTYSVSDNASPTPGISQATTVTIVVDTAPHAHNQTLTTTEDTPLSPAAPGLLIHDFDDEGDQIHAIFVDQPANGTVTISDNGAFTYTPHANFVGTDTFRYQASDGIVASDPATITVIVTAVNDAPSFTLAGNPAAVNEDSGDIQVANFATNISAGPSDESAQTLTFGVTVTGTTGNLLFSTAPAIDSTGKLTYRAAADTNGTATVRVILTDSGSGAAPNVNTSAAQTFTITVNAVNDAPVRDSAAAADVTVEEDSADSTAAALGLSSLSYNAGGGIDEASQTLGAKLTSIPAFITVFKADGSTPVTTGEALTLAELAGLTYKTVPNANGSGHLTWSIQDNGGTAHNGIDSLADSVSVTVSPVNDAPSFTLAGNPSAVNEDSGEASIDNFITAISAGPADEAGQTLSFIVTPTGSTGTLTFAVAPAIDSSGKLTFTPAADTNGTATFSVVLADDGSNLAPSDNTSAAQNFTITVNAVNDAPSFTLAGDPPAVDDTAGNVTVNSFATNISAGPSDESSQTLSFTVTVTNTTGNVAFSAAPAMDASGNLTYSVVAGTSGTASFSVILTDSGSDTLPNVNASGAQSFTITVNLSGNPEGEAGGNANDLALLAYLGLSHTPSDPNQIPDGQWESAVDQAMGQLG